MRSKTRGAATPLLCAAILLGATARAERPLEGRSVILLCYESIDGADTGACAFEADLRRALSDEGAFLVDPAQAARIRNQYAPERFRAGADLAGIDLLDAEIGVVVRARAQKLHSVGRVTSFDTELQVDAIDVSRGNVLVGNRDQASFRALSGSQALGFLAKRFAKEGVGRFRHDLVAALSRPVGVELWVFDLKEGLSQVQAIESAIKDSKLITQHRRVSFDGDLAKWRLTLNAGASADALAVHLEKAGLLLSVQGVTGGMMQLAYRPTQHLKLPVRTSATMKRGVPRWFADDAEDLLKNTLLGEGWILPVDEGAPHMARLSVEAAPAGRGRYALVLTLHGEDGRSIAAVREKGKEPELAALLDKGVTSLLGNFRRFLEKNPAKFAEIKRVFDAPGALDVTLAVGDDGIVRGAALKAQGTVEVRPKLDEGRVRSRLAGLTEFGAFRPLDGTVTALSADDVTALAAVDEPAAIRVEVEVEGKIGPRMYRQVASSSFVFHPATTVDRERLATLARVIDPAPAWSASLLRSALDDAAPLPTPELGRAARAWDRVMGVGLSVVEDAGDERFVAVRPPAATLKERKGTQESLAALVATTFEAAGLETRVVRAPGALLVAVESGLPRDAWPLVAASERGVLVEDERLFVAVDPTSVASDFWRAAGRGSEALSRHHKRLEHMAPRSAWKAEPAAKHGAGSTVERREREKVKLLVLDVRAPSLGKEPAHRLGDALTRAFADIPELSVLSTEDVRRMLDAEALKQAAGCDEASCLSEIADAMGARLVAFASAHGAGEELALSLSLTDTGKASVVERVEVRARDASALASRLSPAAARLAAAFFDKEGIVASGPWAFEAHVGRLAERLPKDPYARARFFALTADLDAAAREAQRVRNKQRRALAEANLALLRGEHEAAMTRFLSLKGEEAAVGGLLAATRAGDTERAQAFQARAKKKLEAPAAETPVRFLVRW